MEKIELRSSILEANEDGELFVSGTVNKTETWSGILGKKRKFREKVKKGVFSDALKEASRVDFLAEHDKNQLLSSTENDSLKLWEDDIGLKMEATIAPTSYGRDTYALIKSNLKNFMSFGFKVLEDSWDIGQDGIYERTIEKIALREVSTVRNPAYAASIIEARGIDVAEDVDIPIEGGKMEEKLKEFNEMFSDEIRRQFLELQEQLKLEIKESISQSVRQVVAEYNNNHSVQPELPPTEINSQASQKEIENDETNSNDNNINEENKNPDIIAEPEQPEQPVEKYDVSEYLEAIKNNQKDRY